MKAVDCVLCGYCHCHIDLPQNSRLLGSPPGLALWVIFRTLLWKSNNVWVDMGVSVF